LLLAGAAYAQDLEDGLRSQIAGVRYNRLAEAARVQGDVQLELNSGGVLLISGPPLLVRTAVESAKALESIRSETKLDVTFHFVLVDTADVRAPTTVKRGNAFERAVLRMLWLRTEKAGLEYQCLEGVPPPNILKVASAGIEIWIYGRARCLQTEVTAFQRGLDDRVRALTG
jgi:hypothetical protein